MHRWHSGGGREENAASRARDDRGAGDRAHCRSRAARRPDYQDAARTPRVRDKDYARALRRSPYELVPARHPQRQGIWRVPLPAQAARGHPS
eukprot:257122-Pyramimonas_sp.AAC.1